MSEPQRELAAAHAWIARQEASRVRKDDAEGECLLILVEFAAQWDGESAEFARAVRFVIRRRIASRIAQMGLIRVPRWGWAQARHSPAYAAIVERASRVERDLDPERITHAHPSAEEEFLTGTAGENSRQREHDEGENERYVRARFGGESGVRTLRETADVLQTTVEEVLRMELRVLTRSV